MPAGSEFHTERAATLKLREAEVVWTRGTDNRLVLEERRNVPGCGSYWCGSVLIFCVFYFVFICGTILKLLFYCIGHT